MKTALARAARALDPLLLPLALLFVLLAALWALRPMLERP